MLIDFDFAKGMYHHESTETATKTASVSVSVVRNETNADEQMYDQGRVRR